MTTKYTWWPISQSSWWQHIETFSLHNNGRIWKNLGKCKILLAGVALNTYGLHTYIASENKPSLDIEAFRSLHTLSLQIITKAQMLILLGVYLIWNVNLIKSPPMHLFSNNTPASKQRCHIYVLLTFSKSCLSCFVLASREHIVCCGATTVHIHRPSLSWAELYTCQLSSGLVGKTCKTRRGQKLLKPEQPKNVKYISEDRRE